MRIFVTVKDIREGRPRSCSRCPIARALKRRFPRHFSVDVSFEEVWFQYRKADKSRKESLPLTAQTFIARFDAELPVTPFSFTLDIPTSRRTFSPTK